MWFVCLCLFVDLFVRLCVFVCSLCLIDCCCVLIRLVVVVTFSCFCSFVDFFVRFGVFVCSLCLCVPLLCYVLVGRCCVAFVFFVC